MSKTGETQASRSFLRHARVIGAFTLLSRLLGLVREMVAGHYLGTGLVASAFTVAFTVPNLFRKLLGEGALAQAFIPLYAQAVQRGSTETGDDPRRFAAASVKLLAILLFFITLIGEAILGAFIVLAPDDAGPDRLLMLKFAAIMLPYVMLICGGAFLAAILQVHKRFAAPAFAPVILNVVHIIVVILGAWFLGLRGQDPMSPAVLAQQTTLAYYLAFGVLVAGTLQVLILWPALKAVGSQFSATVKAWTPDTRQMLRLSLPVAVGAAVLQTSVLLDKAISYTLMQGGDRATELVTHFTFLGEEYRYPMELGATRRLELAQLMYQFPLGIFAIALATAIFPSLAAGAMDKDREQFKRITRQGVEATLWEGLPASVGLILVADPAVRLLFQHGQITAQDATLIAYSTKFYAAGIWSYALLQVINRAYYALHDARTPLYASILNILVNLAVELPLIWYMGEAGMAIGTLVSFSIQAVIMLWLLNRRVGGMGFAPTAKVIVRMLIATAVMLGVCLGVQYSPIYPQGDTRLTWLMQLGLIGGVGAGVYVTMTYALGAARMPRRARRV
jgi:putative peptidoglycan lipid II flippase